MRHWSEPLFFCIGATVSLFYFTVTSPIHMRDGNYGLAMAYCNVCFWLTLLSVGGAFYYGKLRPTYRVWAMIIFAVLLVLPETRHFISHWLLR